MGFRVFCCGFSFASSFVVVLLHSAVLILFLLVHHKAAAAASDQCDLFTGIWVPDKSYPLYDPAVCPFIEREFSCQKNGRPDLDYTQYRWKPLGCYLLRYRSIFLFANLNCSLCL